MTSPKTIPVHKFTPVYIPNQSTRMRMVKEYYSHPLRSEYEKEKSKLYKKSPKRFLIGFLNCLPIIMFFVYWALAIATDMDNSFVILLGIVNLISGPFIMLWANTSLKEEITGNTDGVDELKAKYQKKGLYEITQSKLLSEKCGELNRNDDWVCSATGEYLSAMDLNWCQTPGNCKYCRRFVQAYVGSTEYWSYDFKR